jgi:hypothetical protein
MPHRALRIPLQNGMETECEIRETIKSDKSLSRLMYGALHPKGVVRLASGTTVATTQLQFRTLLRAKPPKGGDAELGDFGDRPIACQPGRQRLEKHSS